MYGQDFQQSMDEPGMVANPARGQPNRKKEDWLIRAVDWPGVVGDSFAFHMTPSRAREACQSEKVIPD